MLRTSVFKILHIGVIALLALTVAMGATGAQPAQAASSSLISAGWMPFAATFPNSNLNINGLVHIVAHWQSVSASEVQVDLSANLPAADVSVITDTGISYRAFGGGQSNSVFLPPNPFSPPILCA